MALSNALRWIGDRVGKKRSRKLTKKVSSGEMEMLGLLWKKGPVTLSEAHAAVERPIGYTTVQTRLNRLVEKGLVVRTDLRPARYQAAISPEDVSANHLDVLVQRVTGGNVVPLVAQLVNDRSLTSDEIEELKGIIRTAERRLGKRKGNR